jgi:hypothetical protein
MAHIQHIDLKGQTYEQVDAFMHELVSIPNNIEFDKLNNRPFRGTVPKNKEMKVYEAILYSKEDNTTIEEVMKQNKRFRLENFFGNMFSTGKVLHGSRYKDTLLFDVSAYDDATHNRHLNLFKLLAEVFEYDNNLIDIYSITKDRHNNARDCCRPFARDSIALLVITLNSRI